MLVFNLTAGPVYYRGRPIPPDGGSLEFADMSYVPTRDMALQENKVLAFGKLPDWWMFLQEAKKQNAQKAAQVALVAEQAKTVEIKAEEAAQADAVAAAKAAGPKGKKG